MECFEEGTDQESVRIYGIISRGFDKQEHGARDQEGEDGMRRMSDELINGSREFRRMERNEKRMFGGNRRRERRH